MKISKLLLTLAALCLAWPVGAAQVDEDQTFSQKIRVLRASNLAVSVATGANTTLLDLDVKDIERIFVQIAPTVQALDAFSIQILPHTGGTYSTVASAAVDFTSPVAPMVRASGDLTTLAAAAIGWFILDTRGVARVKITASAAAAGAATVSIFAGGN